MTTELRFDFFGTLSEFMSVRVELRLGGLHLIELRRVVSAGVLFVLLLAVLAFVFTEIVVQLGLAHPVEGFLAFAPGGQAEMTVLSIIAGADLGFVIVHHLTRILLVITGAPLAARLMRVKDGGPGGGPEGGPDGGGTGKDSGADPGRRNGKDGGGGGSG